MSEYKLVDTSRPIPQDEYDRIETILPIACVDLLVVNPQGEVLLVQRKNRPCAGQWWFPGGRILHGESRLRAVQRKLSEECGLLVANGTLPFAIGTYEFIFGPTDKHSITTLYQVNVDKFDSLVLDAQSSAYSWQLPESWLGDLRLTSGWIVDHLKDRTRR